VTTSDKLNPKIDYVFRRLFGSDENKDLLISLINSVVDPKPAIVDLTIKNPFNLADYRDAKESILDIKAVDQDGSWYDIEMQIEAHILYGRRAIYYLSKTYTDQLESGDDYSKLNTTIGIHFLDFTYFADERMLRQFVFKDTDTNDAPKELNCVRLYFVEMGKFNKNWADIQTALDRWVAFLNKARELDKTALPDQLLGDPAVAKAVAQLERMGMDPQERVIYEGEVNKRMVDAIQLRSAEERGMQQGVQHTVIRLLSRRFGDPPTSLKARLKGLKQESLDNLALDLLDFTSYADVESWLSRH
jgi:predicted transposase/invertase (TIGR01784 family)